MKKETTIDWLIACLPPQKENEDYMKAIITQAKKMEKEQIIDASVEFSMHAKELATKNAENYYKLVYKS